MSVWDLKVTIYIVMAIGFCVALYPRLLNDELSRNVIIFWLAIVPFLTILRIPLVTSLAIIVLLVYLQWQASISQRLFLFLALLAAVPMWFEFKITAGSTDIFIVRYWKLLVLVVLVPALLKILKFKLRFDFVDLLFFIFVASVVAFYLLVDKTLSPIAKIRLSLDFILYNLVVYLVFSRVVSQQPREAILYISYGFMILALILSGIFLFNQAFNVDIYRVHSTAASVYNDGVKIEYRGGFLRTEGPLVAEVMGFLLGAALWSLISVKSILKITTFKFLAFAGLFLFVALSTGSRGVLFTFLMISVIFVSLRIQDPIIKTILFCLIYVGVVVYILVPSGPPAVQDEYGTFDFRAQLWEASIKFISENPFGDSEFVSHIYFDHLRRGPAKFLDVVSVYLQYWLPMGHLGLILYVAPFLITVLQLVTLIIFKSSKIGAFTEHMKLYLVLLCGYLFMISTVSDGGLIGMMGVIFLAISRGLIHAQKAAQEVNNY